MKGLLLAVTIVAASLSTATFAADAAMSVSIGQPGFYGQLDIGDFPRPQVIYAQPRIIQAGPMERDPIYLRVPPGHARNWRKHCGEYNACNERVYFVQDDWYSREYAPRYQKQHQAHRDEGYGNGRDGHQDAGRGENRNKDRGHGRDHRRD